MNYFKRTSLLNFASSRFKRPNLRLNSLSANKIFLAIFLLLLGVGIFYWISTINSAVKGVAVPTINKITIAPPRAEYNINKEFQFSLKDQKGQEVSKFKFVLVNADLRDQILIKGQRGNAPKNKVFLVLNLKITNSYNQSIKINTRDYIRLIVDNNENELLAPEIHNDPLEVQATSTKLTKAAFVVDEPLKKLQLRIGELDKPKTTIELKF